MFTIDEGIELRDAGIKTDIFIYAKFDPSRIDEASKYNLTLNISSFDDLKALKAHVGNTVKVHLKIDTGMTRLGVPFEEAEAFLQEANQLILLNWRDCTLILPLQMKETFPMLIVNSVNLVTL